MIVIMQAIAPNLPMAFPLPLHVIGSAACHYAQLSSGRQRRFDSNSYLQSIPFMEAGFDMIALLRTYVRLSRSEAAALVRVAD